MNLEQAIQHHREWRDRFFAKIAKRQQISDDEVSMNTCEFGKWLYGFAHERYGHLPSVNECISKGLAFHEEAKRVAQLINNGEALKASHEIVNSNTQYHAASAALKQSAVAMFKELEKANLHLQ